MFLNAAHLSLVGCFITCSLTFSQNYNFSLFPSNQQIIIMTIFRSRLHRPGFIRINLTNFNFFSKIKQLNIKNLIDKKILNSFFKI